MRTPSKQAFCNITGLPFQVGPEFIVCHKQNKKLLSTHKSEALARARIRWVWRKKYRLTDLEILDISTN